MTIRSELWIASGASAPGTCLSEDGGGPVTGCPAGGPAPSPGDRRTPFIPSRIPVFLVDRVPGAEEEDQGAWTRTNARYLEPCPGRRPCPPSRFRMVRTGTGIILRVECHVPPLEADGGRLASDTVGIQLRPSPAGGRSTVLALEHAVTALGVPTTSWVAYVAGAALERWDPELAERDRPRQRITRRHSLGQAYAWIVDVLLPWGAFPGLQGAPPDADMVWNGNVERIHPGGTGPRHAAWCPAPVGDAHHPGAMGEFVFPSPEVAMETADPALDSLRYTRPQTRGWRSGLLGRLLRPSG